MMKWRVRDTGSAKVTQDLPISHRNVVPINGIALPRSLAEIK